MEFFILEHVFPVEGEKILSVFNLLGVSCVMEINVWILKYSLLMHLLSLLFRCLSTLR